jgi:hypothetical protein
VAEDRLIELWLADEAVGCRMLGFILCGFGAKKISNIQTTFSV